MHYVYILRSLKDGTRYIGCTDNLKRRIGEHNRGGNKYSSTKYPFTLIWYCAFSSKQKAYNFEKYLKSGSGSAFAGKRLV